MLKNKIKKEEKKRREKSFSCNHTSGTQERASHTSIISYPRILFLFNEDVKN